MKFLLIALVFYSTVIFSQENKKRSIDVIHYDLDISINDFSDMIYVSELITVKYTNDCDSFYLDFASLNGDNQGMFITELKNGANNDNVSYRHSNDKLWVHQNQMAKNDSAVFLIKYKGVPIDGLVIGENKYGKRTFFGDNWPNRAHNWFACVDHPSDKATVNFKIIAPKHYKVVATGEKTQEESDSLKITTTHFFNSNIELPTKVMVFGAADFKILRENNALGFSMSSWIYQDEKDASFKDLKCANDILSFFINNIGSYPFEKLANVQSTTRYGGMENAGNIFYDENAFSGKNTMEALVAHEIAHQWFGNSASEKDWEHLWLSEGFATYFTDLYWENKYGTEEMNKRLVNERSKVVRFSKQYHHSVIDTNYTDKLHLLNPNSYQKGAWVLHMLRNEVGEEIFWKIIKTYYEEYKFSNANSDDFIEIVNQVTGEDYGIFFNQWLKRSGQPKIVASVKQKKNEISIELIQEQKNNTFNFSIDIQLNYDDGSSEVFHLEMDKNKINKSIRSTKKLLGYKLDPHVKLLFEE